ncbi:hypothetical protein SLEP1_g27673 [Rubroshorea leprosula]|uniref:Uncharacterized protein n=1 Tax=Rubroshorea leprosula TaxID=152421 RepID=A0AAV5JXM7_9ROSI|nr:hypothetical protein SLEP1_g27673 [Rubroshorea leprosula]
MRKLDFSLLFLSKNPIWNPEIFPPAGESGSALSFLSCPPTAPALWGRIALNFRSRELPLHLPSASLPLQLRFLQLENYGLNPFYMSMTDLK